MSVFAPYLDQLAQHISTYRPGRVEKDDLDAQVKEMLAGVAETSRSPDLTKAEWELAVKTRVLEVAAREPEQVADEYFADLFDLLDIILTLSEQGVCEPTSPLFVFEDLLDTQTIPSCEVLCGWLESRVPRLTVAIHSSQAMSLVLLRTLNEILRRLSKSAHTPLCGRIMQLLASKIFPFGERSGVNLRGSFNLANVTNYDETGEANEFYTTFWSLQQYFRDPAILASKDEDGPSLAKFRGLVDKVLPAIAEATAKEKLLTGTKDAEVTTGKKRKFTEMMSVDDEEEDNFFPKFLTSAELLDYEMGDTGFRRTILFQMNIFLQHILYYTEKEKPRWQEPKNQSLQMGFSLDVENEKWATLTMSKIIEQLRLTVPAGRTMSYTAQLVTMRERNWIEWKIGLCKDIAKAPIPAMDLEAVRRQLNETASEDRRFPSNIAIDLVEAYDSFNGYEGPEDLERDLSIPRLPDLLKRYKLIEDRVAKRRKILDTAKQNQEAANQKAAEVRKAQAAETLAKEREKLAESQKAAVPATPTKAGDIKKDDNALQLNLNVSAATPPATPPRPGTPPVAQSSAASPKPGGAGALPQLPAGVAGSPGHATPSKPAPAAAAPKPPIPPLPTDSRIVEDETTLSSYNWRALRIGRGSSLHLFSSIGIGELPLLVEAIDKRGAALQTSSQASQTIS
ncbi:hypothetical protein CALVIDRAFT_31330 [Calocera viscosa TUFC12733]|uniref:Uncharacterized protein n=1 Tax=Calocera viscosa (strain TUFC12733) TaxID=1330018 RepID=A0A167PDV6_CALVF|nr:hypothetical protein CALVIDRAFT_31330 [Calocera viscosa TUFC12733]